jgi:hypothetical protein
MTHYHVLRTGGYCILVFKKEFYIHNLIPKYSSMKKVSLLFLFVLTTGSIFSQTTGKITGLKDAWSQSITYIGEIKNKQPNGMGVAIYNNNVGLRYAGSFLNGMYNGKGTLVLIDGSFLSGEWKNGKLNGKGASLSKTGSFYFGNFVDGSKEGRGNMIYKDNGILQGEWKGDKYNGRSIFVPAAATTMSDNIYVEDKKNGPGYQYEIDTKKLFQGVWKEGNWQSATVGNYNSFINAADFYAEKTAAQVLMGRLNKAGDHITDTAFYYDFKNKKRYFGYFIDGKFQAGIIVTDDSSRFIGSLTENSVNGPGSYYKVGAYYDEGNYVKDYLNGPNCLSIDLKTKTIYYGDVTDKGIFTGKAWFANARNDFYNGEYVKGKFTGKGYKINSAGYCIKGVFDDGFPVSVTSITDDKGQAISLQVKTLADAISMVAKDAAATDFDLLLGVAEDEDFGLTIKNKSLVSFPMALKEDYIIEDDDYDLNYVAPYLKTTDLTKAKAKYNELCNQLAVLKITLDKTEGPFLLEKKLSEASGGAAADACTFLFPTRKNILTGYAVSVVLAKDASANYTVKIVLGSSESSLLNGEE